MYFSLETSNNINCNNHISVIYIELYFHNFIFILLISLLWLMSLRFIFILLNNIRSFYKFMSFYKLILNDYFLNVYLLHIYKKSLKLIN